MIRNILPLSAVIVGVVTFGSGCVTEKERVVEREREPVVEKREVIKEKEQPVIIERDRPVHRDTVEIRERVEEH